MSADEACSCGCGVTEVQTVVSTLVSVPAVETRTGTVTAVATTLTNVTVTHWTRVEYDVTETLTVPSLVTWTETRPLEVTTLAPSSVVIEDAELFRPTLTTVAWTDTIVTGTEPVFGVTEVEVPVTRLTEVVETYTVPDGATQTTLTETTVQRVETELRTRTRAVETERVSTREDVYYETATKLMKQAWLPAGTVITLSGVDDAASIMLNGAPVASCASNGLGGDDFIAGECSYTIPKSGLYTFGVGMHVNWGGPSSEGGISCAPEANAVDTVVEYTEQRTEVVSSTVTTVVVDEEEYEVQRLVTETAAVVVEVPGEGTGERVETRKVWTETAATETRAEAYLAGERYAESTRQVSTTVEYEGDPQVRTFTTLTGTDVLTTTETEIEVVLATLTEVETETKRHVVEWGASATTAQTIVSVPTATATAWTVPTVTLTETALRVAKEETVPCACTSHACLGGVYVGTQPLAHARWEEDVAAVRVHDVPGDAHSAVF